MSRLRKNSDFKIFWTVEAVRNLKEILSYLEKNWTIKELGNFKSKLSNQVELIKKNPELFPLSEYNSRLRKAVLSRQTTIFYEISGNKIYLVYLFENQRNIKRGWHLPYPFYVSFPSPGWKIHEKK